MERISAERALGTDDIGVRLDLDLVEQAAAIRHRFFGTRWGLSAMEVMGGGTLVFVAALIFGNA